MSDTKIPEKNVLIVSEMERHLSFLEDNLVRIHRRSSLGSAILMELYLVQEIRKVRTMILQQRFINTGVVPCMGMAECCRQCVDPDQCENSRTERWCSKHSYPKKFMQDALGEGEGYFCPLCEGGQ